MDAFLLVAHLCGVALLFIMISIELVALCGAPRAATIGRLRGAVYAGPAIERIAPVASIIILATGLWMVARLFGIGFSDAWVVVSIIVLVVLSVLGSVVQGRRMTVISDTVQNLPDGPVPASVAALTHDPVLHVAGWGSAGAAFSYLWLMVEQPGLLGSVLAFVVGPVIGILVGQVVLNQAATVAVADSGSGAVEAT